MTLLRRGRMFYWIARELAQKYTRALVFGFAIGLSVPLLVFRLAPRIRSQWFAPTIRIGVVGEFTPSSLPPAIQQQISVGLTEIAPDGSVKPALARSWEATDSGKTFVFHLDGGREWHSGNVVVASDVNYNIRNVTFHAVDEHTLRVTLAYPYSPFPTLVAKPLFQSGLIGLGRYRVGNIRLNGDKVSYLRLVPAGKQKDSVREYRFYKTEALAIAGYKLGEVDQIQDLTNAESLVGWGNTEIRESVKYNRIVTVFFNQQDQRLKEKSFRQALSYAIPDLGGDKADSPISKSSWAYTDKVRHYSFNETQAKKLFESSKVGTSAGELTITTFSPYIPIAQTIATSWSSFGYQTQVKVENALTSSYQILLSVLDVPPDPDQYQLWHQTQIQTNITGYANVKIDKLLEDGRQEMDQAQRGKIYADFQRRLVDDAPVVFLYYPHVYSVTRGQ